MKLFLVLLLTQTVILAHASYQNPPWEKRRNGEIVEIIEETYYDEDDDDHGSHEDHVQHEYSYEDDDYDSEKNREIEEEVTETSDTTEETTPEPTSFRFMNFTISNFTFQSNISSVLSGINYTNADLIQCYSDQVGVGDNGKPIRINIFKDSPFTIASNVMKMFANQTMQILHPSSVSQTFGMINKMTKQLMQSVVELQTLVVGCLSATNKEDRSNYGFTPLSLLDMDEFGRLMGLKMPKHLGSHQSLGSSRPKRQTVSTCPIPQGPLPQSFNWKRRGVVTDSKLQGCNDCFVFSAIAALESAYLLKHGKMAVMSEQVLNECLDGCEGGWITKAYDWLKTHGTTDQREKPYMGEAKPPRHYRPQCTRRWPYTMNNYCYWERLSTRQLKSIVYYYGPTSIGMDSKHSEFRFVRERWAACTVPKQQIELDHALLLVGWTNTDWIIKNSWGKDWGKRGVFNIPRKNDCGVKTFAAVPRLGRRD